MNARFEQLFSELWGVVLCDPGTLAAFHGDDVTGVDLLGRYTTTDEGDRVADAGAAIPVMVTEPGYATVTIVERPTARPLASSSVWVLHVTSGELLVCGLGFLASWDPLNPKHRRCAAERGWYEVDVQLLENAAPDDFGVEFVLRRVDDRPTRTAEFRPLSAP